MPETEAASPSQPIPPEMLTVCVVRALNGKCDFPTHKPLGMFGSGQVLQVLQQAMDTPCLNCEVLEEPGAGPHTHQLPSLPSWSPCWQQYLAVLAAVPPGTLGSLSQLASGGIAAAVGALLQDREGLKHSQKPPERPFFIPFWGDPVATSPGANGSVGATG